MSEKYEGFFDPFAVFSSQQATYPEGDADHGGDDNYPEPARRNSLNVVAKLFWAQDGGPIRTIIDGRKTRPTGTFHALKGGARAMPWESKLERMAMCMADLSSRVHYLLAQPHRLEINVRGNRGKSLIYFPDLLLQVHPSFVEDLRNGMPFSQAARVPAPREVPSHRLQNLILEIKADDDPRDNDPVYQRKLSLAEELYSRRGCAFFKIRKKEHLGKEFSDLARRADLNKFVPIDERDYQTCLSRFGGRDTIDRAGLERAFGGGPLSRAKVFGLHYRRFISIDFATRAAGNCPVHLISQGGAR
ncbi:hypothetical protein G6L29_10665 [Agrobacterium rhizogenes]|uniref:hypothetical protein n=1 Tax=Rhizobium rhizogenes TaxID=359 RepID=UPI0015735756|nr:hypothetical protein [Rhizobium rhizogenes]NTI16097.1 hypothetical protein [Rhizobium rhizogenes]